MFKMRDELDRISNLPGDVRLDILCRLPLRDAARTSILSSHWRYEWVKLPSLVFKVDECVEDINYNSGNFSKIVDDVLLSHIGPIRYLYLSSSAECHLFSKDIDRWIRYVSRNAIKDFTLRLDKETFGESSYEIPSCLFSSQDMTDLELENCFLKPPSQFKGLSDLKSLTLHSVRFVRDLFENLIVCCPQLEILTINCSIDTDTYLKIDSPSLKFLQMRGGFQDVNLDNTLNLETVIIEFNTELLVRLATCSSSLVKFFAHLPRIRKLIIEGCFLEYLAFGCPPEKLPNPCLHLKCLYLDIWFGNYSEILTALCILRSSPSLQELKICAYENEGSPCLDSNQKCRFPKLRFVDIICYTDIEVFTDFIKLLLSSSPVLETMTLGRAAPYISLEPIEELLPFRASEHAQIIIVDDESDDGRYGERLKVMNEVWKLR